MKRLLLESLSIILLSLCLSLLYNALSREGLRILPKKKPQAMHAVPAPSGARV